MLLDFGWAVGEMFLLKCSQQTLLLKNAYHYVDDFLTRDCFSKGSVGK